MVARSLGITAYLRRKQLLHAQLTVYMHKYYFHWHVIGAMPTDWIYTMLTLYQNVVTEQNLIKVASWHFALKL